MRTVPLLGAVILNGGDAAIALGSIGFLEEFGLSPGGLTVFDRNPDESAPLYPELTVEPWLMYASFPSTGSVATRVLERIDRLRRFPAAIYANRPIGRALLTARERRAAQRVIKAPFAVATGGTYLVDHYRWEMRLPELELAVRAGVPLVFLTQSMGPFERSSWGNARLGAVLEAAVIVMARDAGTRAAVQRLAPGANVVLAPDMAFQLFNDPHVRDLREQARDRTERPRIAVSVREWPYLSGGAEGERRYRQAVAEVVTALVRERGASVTFVSTCQGTATYRFDDSAVADEVAALLAPDIRRAVSVDHGFRRPTDFVKQMASFDLLVGTRMHATVMAWIAGTPAVAIAYEAKTERLFARHGAGHLVHGMDSPSVDGILDSVSAVLEDGQEGRDTLYDRVLSETEELSRIGNELASRLGVV